jgi:branched-chain amino acid transport system ATP-binding protein
MSTPGSEAPALELRHVSAGYGRFQALFDVSFSVARGSVAAMLGPNGAGKSTVARVVTGLVPATAGSVLIGGEDVTGLTVSGIVHHGVAYAPEGRPVFATLDVEDNLRLTLCRQLPRRQAAAALEAAYERFPALRRRRRQLAGTLSGGEQRILALARVLAVPPKLLVVDELSLGLAPKTVSEVFSALREINEAGTTLLVVEQQASRALGLADHVILLRKGSVTHAGPAAGLSEDLVAELLSVAPRTGHMTGSDPSANPKLTQL